jgi:hypothetical protein
MRDETGGYQVGLLALVAAYLVSAGLMLMLRWRARAALLTPQIVT